jgi:hypothetical protein
MFIDSKEKQVVREKLWLPVFVKLGKVLKTNKIKYLCLPGADCIELKYLVGKGVLDLQDTIAVERKDVDAALIQTYLSGSGRLYAGSFEDIIVRCQQFIDEFNSPFNIINLDCYGSANPFGNLPITSNIAIVRRIVELQSQKASKNFNLLLTFKADDSIKGYSGQLSQLKSHLSNYANLDADIQKHPKFKKVKKTITLETLQVISIGFDNHFKTRLVDPPITYIGKPHTTRMVSYSFEFTKMKEDKTQFRLKANKEKFKSMDEALLKNIKAKFI